MMQPEFAQVLVVAGEPSGDRAAARVVREMKRERNGVSFFGVGGEFMDREGVTLVANIENLTSFGLLETFKRFSRWVDAWIRIREAIERFRPKVALLVDAPEVNLPLSRVLKEAGIKVVFYIGPQVWAWREQRLLLMKERVDVTALILPFEMPFYEKAGANAVFVGHPVMDEIVEESLESVRNKLGIGKSERLVAFFPGSRASEIRHHAAPMAQAAQALERDGIRSILVCAGRTAEQSLAGRFEMSGSIIAPLDMCTREVLRAVDGAIVTSGTATLEAAVEAVPHVIVYRMDPLSFAAARALVKTPYIGLPNLVAGRQIAPELIQDMVTGESIYREALRLLNDDERKRQISLLSEVKEKLGSPGAAKRVADLVLERIL